MIRNKDAYWNAVNRNATATHWTPRDRAGAVVYWERASRFYRDAVERGDTQTAAAQAKTMREYENILGDLDAAEGGGI